MSTPTYRSIKFSVTYVFFAIVIIFGLPLGGQKPSNRYTVNASSVDNFSTAPDWVTTGTQQLGQYGIVSPAGDLNGDGFDDIAVGSTPWPTSTLPGKVDIYYGSTSGLSLTPDLTITGSQAGAQFGSVMSAGDVNADGFDDLLVGAAAFDNGNSNEGKVFLYYGSSSGLNASEGWSFEGNSDDAKLGSLNIKPYGDINRDGYSDILISSLGYQSGIGRTYAFYGSSDGLGTTPSWVVTGDQAGSSFGVASVLGDVNNDGYLDVGIGAQLYDNGQTNEGRAFVYYGSSSGLSHEPDWIVEGNISGLNMGFQIAPAGDVNNDGFSDFAVSCYSSATTTYVYYGSASGPNSIPDWTKSPGVWPNTVGDVNFDGFDDLIIGYPWQSYARGQAWIFPGSSTGLLSSSIWTDMGETEEDHYGWPAGSAGDINRDGAEDLLIGAHAYYDYDVRFGRAYLYHGAISRYNVTGIVLSIEGSGIEGVTVSDGYYSNSITNNQGLYSLSLPKGTHNLSASKSGYIFTPNSLTVNLTSNKTGQNFIGEVIFCGDGLETIGVDSSDVCQSPLASPFLRLPINTTSSPEIFLQDTDFDGGRIDSWFDHNLPNYLNNRLITTYDSVDRGGEAYKYISGHGCYANRCYDGHNGIDITFYNDEHANYKFIEKVVIPAASGTVIEVCTHDDGTCRLPELGKYVIISHLNNTYATLYAHLSEIVTGIVVGSDIYRGEDWTQSLGVMGSTGNSTGDHLHFQVFYNKDRKDPWDGENPWEPSSNEVVDPYGWVSQGKSDPWTQVPSVCLWLDFCPSNSVIEPTGNILTVGGITVSIPPDSDYVQYLFTVSPTSFSNTQNTPLRSTGGSFSLIVSEYLGQFVDFHYSVNEVSSDLTTQVRVSVDFSNFSAHFDVEQLSLYQFDDTLATWNPVPTTLDQSKFIASAQVLPAGYFDVQAPLLCPADISEPYDDNPSQKTILAYDQMNALLSRWFDIESDEDWVSFEGIAGVPYEIRTQDLATGVDTYLAVYSSDGQTILAEDDNSGGGASSLINWTPLETKIYFVRVSQAAGTSFGCDSSYNLAVNFAYPIPSITTLDKDFAYLADEITIMVNGNGFTSNSIIYWGDTILPTTYVDSETLSATVTPELNMTSGEIPVTVVNPTPGGGTSNAIIVRIYGYSPLSTEKLTTSKVTFAWDAIPDTEKYKIQLSTAPDFSVLLLNLKVTEPTYFFDSFLQHNKIYYWRIKPIYVDSKGAWLPTWQFISMDPLGKPILTAPEHKELIYSSEVTLQWDPVDYAAEYKVLIAKDALFAVKYDKVKTADLYATINNLPPGKYFWRVRAFDEYGAKGPWSDYRIFKIVVP